MTVINQTSEIRGARSSHQQPALTRPPIDTNRVGLKLLAPDLAKDLVLASQDGLHSEQNSPRSESNLCITCYKPKSITYDSVKVDRCVCDNNEPSVIGDTELNTQAEDLPHKPIPAIDSETAVINRFRDEIITECIDCEFCGSPIMEDCTYLSHATKPRRCTMHEKSNKLRKDIVTLTTECSSVWSPQMELDVLTNHRLRLNMVRARSKGEPWRGSKTEEKYIDVDNYFRPIKIPKIPYNLRGRRGY